MAKVTSKKVFDLKKLPSLLIVCICFGGSALLSIIALKTQGATLFSMCIFGSFAIVLEMIKFHFPCTAIVAKDMPGLIRVIFLLVGIWAIFYSITFSFAFSKNEAATVKNVFVANSSEVKKAEKSAETRDGQIARLKEELVTLKTDKTTEVNKWHPVTYRTKRKNISDTYDLRIQKKQGELTTSENEGLKESKNTPVISSQTIDKGVTGLFGNVEAENNFFKSFAIFLEIGGIFGLVDLRRKNRKVLKQYTVYEDVEPYAPTNVQGNQENGNNGLTSIPGGKDQKKKNSPPLVSKEAIKIYAEAALQSLDPNDNSCAGLTKIAKQTGYSRDKLNKAKAFLENKDAIYVDGLTTYVNDIDILKKYA